MERLNITLDDEQFLKLERLAARMHVQPGTIARSLGSDDEQVAVPAAVQRRPKPPKARKTLSDRGTRVLVSGGRPVDAPGLRAPTTTSGSSSSASKTRRPRVLYCLTDRARMC